MPLEDARDPAELFEAALGRSGPERSAFLDRECAGDPAIRAEVEDLLRWHERAENGGGDLPALAAAQTASALMRASSLASGRFGRFSIESRLGEGATAIVYRAIDTSSNCVVALKVGSARTLLDPASRRRFEQAAAATRNLGHPHIARVLDSGVEQDVPWLALEFVDGRTLADLLRSERPDLARALKLGRQIAGALTAAHEQGIIHRDLKPANIMIGADGDAKVLDFGLCHAVPGRDTIAGTQSGFLLGTPGYMAPELARGVPPAPASDVFSLGAVLYEVFAGAPAFRGETTVATLSCVLHETPPPMRGVPSAIQDLVERCLDKKPARRPSRAAEVASALARLERGLAAGRVRVRPGWDGLRSRVRRMPRRAAIGFAAAVVVFGVLGAVYRFRPHVRTPAPRQITFDEAALNTEPAVSHDRKWIAFASDRSGEGNLDLYMVSTVGPGRLPRRVTKHEINVRQPEFSPDGRTLMFRSDRDGGGIFKIGLDSTVPGAQASMVVAHGLHPKFSPDGKRLAYWVGLDTSGDVLAPGGGKIYVLDGTRAKPRQVCPEFPAAAYPIWSPDGQSILFIGHRYPAAHYADPFVWMTAAEVCSPIAVAKPQDFPDSKTSERMFPLRWLRGNRLFFQSADMGLSNLIELQVSRAPGAAEIQARHLTFPANRASMAEEAGFAYAELRNGANLWSMRLGMPSNAGSDSAPERIVTCGGEYCIPALSRDGGMLFYSRTRPADGQWEFVRRGLGAPGEKVVAQFASSSPWPFVIGPQHDLVFSRNLSEDLIDAQLVSGKTGAQVGICQHCPELWDVSSSGHLLLAMASRERRTIELVNTSTRRETELLSHPQWNLYRASFSPDERSILFTAKIAPDRAVIYVADFSGGKCGPPESWVAVSDDTEYNGPAHWSDAGDRVYFTSQRDGHRCFYARLWDARRRVPAGPITAVRHFHAEGESPGLIPQSLFGFAVARDRIVFEMGRRTGNIWIVN